MSIADIEPGLRERKRRATRRAIQVAAVDLVTERGLDGTTVDEISRRADVSPRTFFNYFPSKEIAITGDHPSMPDADAIEEFVASVGEPLMTGLARMIVRSVGDDDPDQDLMLRRRSVLAEYPQLFAQRMNNMKRVEEELASVIARRLAADDPALAADSEALASRAHLASFVAFGAMRHAWLQWANGPAGSSLDERITASFAALPSVVG